ncbi:hypothetical protein CK203_074341 [Vitis vinifera]|uniref:Uncharacterized protein n=1 Tax=Vitis vinifera TaxID=29760 RepID=A0A438BYU7_VITVI|nr:hypothetical protein CK203_074341 [Vitis vinifera]
MVSSDLLGYGLKDLWSYGEERLPSMSRTWASFDISLELRWLDHNKITRIIDFSMEVLDALVNLFCRSNISAETLWDGGWALRQLLPYNETEFNSHHLELLKDSYRNCIGTLLREVKGFWLDLLITVLCDEWRNCKRAIEASSPRREPKYVLLPLQKSSFEEVIPVESSIVAGERMCELVKVFVLLHQLQIFSLGRALPDQPPILPPIDVPQSFRAKAAGLGVLGPKPGTELRLVDAVPCRISFERAVSMETSGWVLLAEELPLKQHYGVVRVTAPLAGSNPKIDDKHARWLHLRIRPSTLPFLDSDKRTTYAKVNKKALVDGRWTLAFSDEYSCKSALSMILEEINLQSNEVERRIRPLLDLEREVNFSSPSPCPLEASSSSTTPSNSLLRQGIHYLLTSSSWNGSARCPNWEGGCGGATFQEIEEMAVEVGCRVGSLPSQYLGLPLGAPNKAPSVWDGVEEKVRRRLARFAYDKDDLWKQVITAKYGQEGHGWRAKRAYGAFGVGCGRKSGRKLIGAWITWGS